jgi:hypothetical protein
MSEYFEFLKPWLMTFGFAFLVGLVGLWLQRKEHKRREASGGNRNER